MSTTRHLLNRRRRLAAQPRDVPPPEPADGGTGTRTGTTRRTSTPGDTSAKGAVTTAVRPRTPTGTLARPGSRTTSGQNPNRNRNPKPSPGPRATTEEEQEQGREQERETGRGSRAEGTAAEQRPQRAAHAPRRLLVVCVVLIVVLGGFAAWASAKAGALRSDAAAHNSALADAGRTSEVKGEVSGAVNALFSYDYAHPGKNARAAGKLLSGRAVDQHRKLLAQVRAQAVEQRLVLTTTVTDSAVSSLEGDRARVLLFADQHSARTGASGGAAAKSDTKDGDKSGKREGKKPAADDGATYAGAMLSVDAVRKGGTWKIAAIDTLN